MYLSLVFLQSLSVGERYAIEVNLSFKGFHGFFDREKYPPFFAQFKVFRH